MQVVNLTPHPVALRPKGSPVEVVLDPESSPARVSLRRTVIGHVEIDGVQIPVCEVTPGRVYNLPEPQPGVLYLVSAMVGQSVGRLDLVGVDRVDRNSNGQVTCAEALSRFSLGWNYIRQRRNA